MAQSEEDGGKEAEGLSCEASDDLSDSRDEDKNHRYASPSVQAVIRNPKYLKCQTSASPQKKGKQLTIIFVVNYLITYFKLDFETR